MKIAVLNETGSGEARVALMPDSVTKLVAAKASVSIEAAPVWARLVLTTTTPPWARASSRIEVRYWLKRRSSFALAVHPKKTLSG